MRCSAARIRALLDIDLPERDSPQEIEEAAATKCPFLKSQIFRARSLPRRWIGCLVRVGWDSHLLLMHQTPLRNVNPQSTVRSAMRAQVQGENAGSSFDCNSFQRRTFGENG